MKTELTLCWPCFQDANLTLPDQSSSLSSKLSAVIDTSPAVVVRVASNDGFCNGIYSEGERIVLTVLFSHPVVMIQSAPPYNDSKNSNLAFNNSNTSYFVSEHVPTPAIDLSLANINQSRTAILVSSDLAALQPARGRRGSYSVHFEVKVQENDSTSRLDYLNRYALNIRNMSHGSPYTLVRAPESHISRRSSSISTRREFEAWDLTLGVSADLLLPERATASSLGQQSDVVVDHSLKHRPYIWLVALESSSSSVNDPDVEGRSNAGTGNHIYLMLRFTEKVFVYGAPRFAISINRANNEPLTARYLSGNATDELVFSFTIKAGDSEVCIRALSGALRCGCVAPLCRIEGLGRRLADTWGLRTHVPALLRLPLQWPSFSVHASLFLDAYRHITAEVYTPGTPSELRQNTSGVANATIYRANGTDTDAARLLSTFLNEIPASSFFSASQGATVRDIYSRFKSLTAGGSVYDVTPDIVKEKHGCIGAKSKTVRVLEVTTNHASGTWGAGEIIDIAVRFSAPIMLIGGSARLRLEVGDAVITRRQNSSVAEEATVVRKFGFASYLRGNNTARLYFR